MHCFICMGEHKIVQVELAKSRRFKVGETLPFFTGISYSLSRRIEEPDAFVGKSLNLLYRNLGEFNF
jgi:hypothetical protein